MGMIKKVNIPCGPSARIFPWGRDIPPPTDEDAPITASAVFWPHPSHVGCRPPAGVQPGQRKESHREWKLEAEGVGDGTVCRGEGSPSPGSLSQSSLAITAWAAKENGPNSVGPSL